MTRLTIAALLAGLSLATALLVASGSSDVADALGRAGPGVLLVVLARAAAVAVAGAGWYVLFPGPSKPRLGLCVGIRFVREATNGLLPLAQIGGDLIGARLLTMFRVPGALAGASVVVDVLVQAATQLTFVLIGLGALLALGGDPTVAAVVAAGLCVGAVLLVLFYFAQRRFGQRLMRSALSLLGSRAMDGALGSVDAVFARLDAFHRRPDHLARSYVVHLAGWIVGVFEVYVGLALVGYPVGFAEALAIESLMHAIRGAAFPVPGAIGIQEGSLVALCALFGVPAAPALALALVKRAADLSLGLPGLLAWQALEGRWLMRSDAGADVGGQGKMEVRPAAAGEPVLGG